jgi:hypothetical protein
MAGRGGKVKGAQVQVACRHHGLCMCISACLTRPCVHANRASSIQRHDRLARTSLRYFLPTKTLAANAQHKRKRKRSAKVVVAG